MIITLHNLKNQDDPEKLLILNDVLYTSKDQTAFEPDHIISAKLWVDRPKEDNSSS